MSMKEIEPFFSIKDYEELRTSWGKFVRIIKNKNGEEHAHFGITFHNNKLIVGYKLAKQQWNENNCVYKYIPEGFADYEARFVQTINDMYDGLIKKE